MRQRWDRAGRHEDPLTRVTGLLLPILVVGVPGLRSSVGLVGWLTGKEWDNFR